MENSTTVVMWIGIVVVFALAGYFIWKNAKETYDYNIFNTGVLVRGVLAIILGITSFLLIPEGGTVFTETGTIILLVVMALLFLSNLFYTAKHTSIGIALAAFIYQMLVIFVAFYLVMRVIGWFQEEFGGE